MMFLYILVGFLILLILLALFAPKKYDMSRSITINRSVEEVYEYLRQTKNQDYWSPWKQKDPNMKQEYFGTDGEVGFIARWEGNKDVGVGEQEIKKLTKNERIDTELRFFKPWKAVSDAYFIIEGKGSSTEVVWGFSGINKAPLNIMMLFMNMDKSVGKDFNEGLASLKEIMEK